ncbi:MAG: CRISPR-associated protein Cas5 [Ignavibacteriales bacterium]|nr:CRISPR-associated protein Cas5 [Ignavibacteriales bacterium]
MKTLIFDVTGEFAHFRKFNTTSSPLTYLIPTRTAVAGLLGAIVGFGREEFYEYFLREKAEIAIQAKNKLTKQGYAFNLINTKEGMNRIKAVPRLSLSLWLNPIIGCFSHMRTNRYITTLSQGFKKNGFSSSPISAWRN